MEGILMRPGFFMRQDVRSGAAAKPITKSTVLSEEQMRKMGLRLVEGMNPQSKTRHMAPTGSERPFLYLLGEAPGEVEDSQGRPFVGPSGKLIRSLLPDNLPLRINNCVRTFPPFRNGTRTPNRLEICAYYNSVAEDIARTKPNVILAVGQTPLDWCLGGYVGTITACRGRKFPVNIAGHQCWCLPTWHPAFILRKRDGEYSDVPGEEYERFFKQDVAEAVHFADWPDEPLVEDPEGINDGVRVETRDARKVVEFIQSCRSLPAVTIDVETTSKRCYATGAKLLTLALGNDQNVLAFPLDHPQAMWNAGERRAIDTALKELFRGNTLFLAHKAEFDLEWLSWKYGEAVRWESRWGCTICQAYILDCREGGHTLQMLSALHFGLLLKDHAGVDRKNLVNADLSKILPYNGRDVKYQHKLYLRQSKQLRERGLDSIYREHVRRIPSAVALQATGLASDINAVRTFQSEESEEVTKVIGQMEKLDSVKRYKAKYGAFNANAPEQVGRVLSEFCGHDEVRNGIKFTTGEKILSLMKDEPLAQLVLDLRGAVKLKGTYVDRLDPAHEKSHIFPDGRIHCVCNPCKTDSGRWSIDSPSLQNFPKRGDGKLRSQIVAPPGHVMLCCDQGQIEYRVIGMHSGDKVVVESIFNDYDVHMEWARIIAEEYPRTFQKRHGHIEDPKKRMKSYRSEIKNQMVFPAFYWAGETSIARALEVPIEILSRIFRRFWKKFEGVREWQHELLRFYEEYGYTEALSGRRRHGPLSRNMVVNNPVQGAASDIVVWSQNDLARKAYETQRPWLTTVIQVHDDLTFYVPKEKVNEGVREIATSMTSVPFDWINVPLQVEVSVGPNWYEQKEIGKFRSDRLQADFKKAGVSA